MTIRNQYPDLDRELERLRFQQTKKWIQSKRMQRADFAVYVFLLLVIAFFVYRFVEFKLLGF